MNSFSCDHPDSGLSLPKRDTLIAGVLVFPGGVRACAALFRALAPLSRSRLAVVLMPHNPRCNSIPGPVLKFTGEAAVRGGKVYRVPPGREAWLEDGCLRLGSHRGAAPYDEFLLSLARTERERATAVVLPARGAEACVRGLNAVRAAGGLTFGSSMARRRERLSGVVDLALPPAQIAAALARLAVHAAGAGEFHTAATCRALFEGAAEAIVAVDRSGRIVAANRRAKEIFGYEEQELAGQRFELLLPPRARAENRSAWKDCLRGLRRQSGRSVEIVASRRNGAEFPADISVSAVETVRGPVALAFISDVSEPKRAQEELQRRQQELRAVNARLVSLQEDSDRRIARELHDALSQKIAALGMRVNTLGERASRVAPHLAAAFSEVSRGITGLAADLHDLSRRLHPTILDELGLAAALKSECIGFEREHGIPVTCVANGRISAQLPNETALALYRIAQQAMRNAAEHARPKALRVVLGTRGRELSLAIADDGLGFDVERARRRCGLGLITMEERARMVNGALYIHSTRGEGTTVEVRVPVRRLRK